MLLLIFHGRPQFLLFLLLPRWCSEWSVVYSVWPSLVWGECTLYVHGVCCRKTERLPAICVIVPAYCLSRTLISLSVFRFSRAFIIFGHILVYACECFVCVFLGDDTLLRLGILNYTIPNYLHARHCEREYYGFAVHNAHRQQHTMHKVKWERAKHTIQQQQQMDWWCDCRRALVVMMMVKLLFQAINQYILLINLWMQHK